MSTTSTISGLGMKLTRRLIDSLKKRHPAPTVMLGLFPSILITFLGLKIAQVYLEGNFVGFEIVGRGLERRLDDISWWVLFNATLVTLFIWRSTCMLAKEAAPIGKRSYLRFSLVRIGWVTWMAWNLGLGATYLANVRSAKETFWYPGSGGILAIQWFEGTLNLLAIAAMGYWMAVMVSVIWWTRNDKLRKRLPKTVRFSPDGILKTVFVPVVVGSVLWGLYEVGFFKLMQESLGWSFYPFAGRSGWTAIGFCFLGWIPFMLIWIAAILIWLPDLKLRADPGVPPFNAQFRSGRRR